MTRRLYSDGFQTEGLQTDVMRFMAIIAFCLIAIMTLVDKRENPVSVGPEAEHDGTTPVSESVQLDQTKIVPEKLATVPESSPLEIPDDSVFDSTDETTDLVEKTAAPKELQAAPTDSHKPALALRFASDESFIRLIAAEGIGLFARQGDRYLHMTSEFDTVSQRPSGELYELLPSSVPRSVSRAIETELSAPVYLVSLSDRTRDALQEKLHTLQDRTGTLVIDKDGGISYEI